MTSVILKIVLMFARITTNILIQITTKKAQQSLFDFSRSKLKSLLAVAYFPQEVAPPVSSALERFTTVFGMGTGGATLL